MKVSVIIPVYNGAKWLADCLDSLLQQSFHDFEVIAIDDGSSDDSASILAEYGKKDDRIKIITTENRGVSAARNLGMEQAAGEYIRFADCDDLLPEDSLAKLVRAIEQGNCQLAIGSFCEKSQKRQTKRTLIEESGIFSRQEYLAHLKRYPRSFFYSALWNKLYKRDVIMKHGIRFDESMTWSEDFLFNIHYVSHIAGAAVLEEEVYVYRHHPSGLTFSFAKRIPRHPITSLKLILFLFKHYRKLCLESSGWKLGAYWAFFRGTHGC